MHDLVAVSINSMPTRIVRWQVPEALSHCGQQLGTAGSRKSIIVRTHLIFVLLITSKGGKSSVIVQGGDCLGWVGAICGEINVLTITNGTKAHSSPEVF